MAKYSPTVAAIVSFARDLVEQDRKLEVRRAQMVGAIRKAGSDAGFAWDRPTYQPLVLEAVSAIYGVALLEGERKAKGKLVLDSAAEGYERARKMSQRLMGAMFPEEPKSESGVKAKSEPATEYEIPAEIAELATKLVAACREYDVSDVEMKRWAASAIATAFAQKA